MTSPVKQFENGLKLGKTPARPEAAKLKFAQYADLGNLPTPPADFGHDSLVTDWPMLGNDQYGDCVFAGSLHQLQLYNRMRGVTLTPSDSDALRNYSQVTGFNPNDPNTDQGTDMVQAADYWRKTGMLAARRRHKIKAYTALSLSNMDQLKTALYLFGAVGIGIEFPAFAMDQFNEGKPWDVSGHNTSIEGGHYIPAVGFHNGNIIVVTWGKAIQMTPAFYSKYADEALVFYSTEMMKKAKSLEGFNDAALVADLTAVTHEK